MWEHHHSNLLTLLIITIPEIPHRSIFDTDNIDIGPERRAYLENKLERVWEQNSQVSFCGCSCLRGEAYSSAICPLSWNMGTILVLGVCTVQLALTFEHFCS